MEAPLDNSFMKYGACVKLVERGEAQPEFWYPDAGDVPRKTDARSGPARKVASAEAKKLQVWARNVCNKSCPVRALCLAYALNDPRLSGPENFGIWGGTTTKQRSQMINRRKKQKAKKEKANA